MILNAYTEECSRQWAISGKKLPALQVFIKALTFSPITTDETFKINKGPLNCNSKNAYLLGCKKCKNVYVEEAQKTFV